MAEDEETATARYIASNVSTQLMLKTLFEIIATMADDPDRYRSGMRKQLLKLADTMLLSPMVAARERESPWFRQRDGRQSIDEPAAQPARQRRGQMPLRKLVSPKRLWCLLLTARPLRSFVPTRLWNSPPRVTDTSIYAMTALSRTRSQCLFHKHDFERLIPARRAGRLSQ